MQKKGKRKKSYLFLISITIGIFITTFFVSTDSKE